MSVQQLAQELLKLRFRNYCIAYIDILGAKKHIKDDPSKFLNNLKTIHENALLEIKLSEMISQRKFFIKIFSDNILVGAQIVGDMTYQKDKWTKDYQLKYYLEDRKRKHINPKIDKVLLEVYELVSEKGINEVINSKTLKKIYKKHVGD